MNKEIIKAILFDLDGTLFRSEACDYVAWKSALEEHGLVVPADSYYLYAGKSAEFIEEDIIRRSGKNIKKGAIITTKKRIFVDLFGKEDIVLMPYAKEAVQFFLEKPLLLGLCTGGTRTEVDIKLNNTDIDDDFSVIVTADDVLNNKPAPDVYLKAMNDLGLTNQECLAIEDTETGLSSAKNAGLYCFAIPNHFSKNHDFSRADRVLGSLKDLIDYFN